MLDTTGTFYEEIGTAKPLADFVKRFWRFSNPTANTQHYTILPDGYFDLIIKFKANKLESITLFGLWTKEVELTVATDTIIIGICFKPLAAEYILQQHIAGTVNNFETLQNDLWNINNIQFDNLEKWTEEITNQLLQNLKNARAFDNRKQSLFNLLFQLNGSLTVEELSKQVFWSSRQINRYFKKKVWAYA